MKVLVLNSGSSSQKACLYEIGEALPDDPPVSKWEGRIEWAGSKASTVVKNSVGVVVQEEVSVSSRQEVVSNLLSTAWSGMARVLSSAAEIDAVGHRVVHGGPHFEEPVVVTSEVRSVIASVSKMAPLHIQSELEGIESVQKLLGEVPQIAVFDTGFHRQMPLSAMVYPGPYEWFEQGIHRYGFHGINHQYCAGRAAQLLKRDLRSLKMVTCHLGNGCSVAAIHNGRSVDTTMGFTPLEGLMMGTRSGSVDPGILTFLMRQRNLNGQEIDHLLNQESGLLGISGLSSDMRDILDAAKTGHRKAKLAFEIYVHRVRSAIGAMSAVLGGMDVLVFTAGVGENSSEVRAAACTTLEYLGLKIDPEINAQPRLDADVAAQDSRVRVLVIRAEEDWAIAKECWRLARIGAPVGSES
jgi:acetate kinase